MCENARIFQLTAVETLQRSLPCKQPQLFATVTSFRGNNAICRPHTDTVAAATILQCLLWREQSKQPVYFSVSSASCLLICGTSTHTQTHTCRQLECHCQPGKRSKTRPHLCCNWGIWFICNAARLCRVYRVYRVYSHAICWHIKHKCAFLNTP